MYRYNYDFFEKLKEYAKENLGGLGVFKNVENRNLFFTRWIQKFEKLSQKKSLKGGSDIRAEHNEMYNTIIKEVERFFDSRYTNDIIKYVVEVNRKV